MAGELAGQSGGPVLLSTVPSAGLGVQKYCIRGRECSEKTVCPACESSTKIQLPKPCPPVFSFCNSGSGSKNSD